MAYPAVVCLQNTVQRLLNSPRISFRHTKHLKFLKRTHHALEHLLVALVENDEKRWNVVRASERVKLLEAELRKAAAGLEDSIKTQLSAQLLSQSGRHPIPPVFSINLGGIHDQLQHFISTAERMKAAYEEEDDDDDDDEDAVPPPIYFDGGDPSKLVGFADLFNKIKYVLVNTPHYRDLSVSGMAGIGKTTMAKKVLEDPLIKETFTRRIFVKVGLEPKVNCEIQLRRISQAIVAQVDTTLVDEVENSKQSLWERRNEGKTLIVLDDVWSKQLWDRLRMMLPNKHNGCKMLVTTRTRHVSLDKGNGYNLHVRFMNKEESWDLLRRRVFGEEARVPEELVKAGKKIAENCEGLPLLIIAVADLLSGAERTKEFWSRVAADKENHIFVDAYEQISKVLLPSYYSLPLQLKPCFLYLRVFPQNHQLRCSRLIKLLSSEDLLCKISGEEFGQTVESYCHDLTYNNVMLVSRESKSELHGVKVYGLHSSFWYLCKKQAEDIKILHTFNRYADASVKNIKGQRRLAIYKNILLGIKHVYNSVASVPKARSLLCTGAYHKYQVPICFDVLRLLGMLDAHTIRFYEFPIEVLQLILLKYLSFTCNGNLSPSISRLGTSNA